MPEYIAIIICVYILAFTSALKRPCAAIGIRIFDVCYVMACVLALSLFQLRIGMEISINLGAAVLAFMPGLMMKKQEDSAAGIGALMLISIAISLLKYSGDLFGTDNGLLCGLMAGMSAFVYGDNPSTAAYAAGSIPLISAAMDTLITLIFSGYASVEIGHDIIVAQLTALGISIVIIWIHSLLPKQAETD